MTLQPTEDRVRIEPIEKTATGLITTGDTEEAYSRIVAIGPWVTQVKAGDLIFYDREAVEHYQLSTDEHIYLIREHDIDAIYTPTKGTK